MIKIFWLLAAIILLFLNSTLHLTALSLPVSYLLTTTLGISMGMVLYTYSTHFRIERAAAIALFTLFWGHHIFNGFVYYDELTRFELPTNWLLSPVNDHLHPWTFPVWYLQYTIGKGHYAVLSSTFYLFAIIGIAAFSYVIGFYTQEKSFRSRLFLILFASVPLHSPYLWQWKGCGDAPILSFMWLSLWMATLCRFGDRLNLRHYVAIFFFYIMTTGSSSAITLSFIFAVPFLWMPQFRQKKFYTVIGGGLFFSALYWIIRSQLVSDRSTTSIPDPFTLIFAYAGVFKQFAFDNIFVALPMIVLLAGLALILLKKEMPLWSLATLGLFIFGLGAAQLVAARGLTYGLSPTLTGYHMHFPFMGAGVLVAMGFLYWEPKSPKVIINTLCSCFLVFVLVRQHQLHTKTAKANNPIITLRKEFFRDLKALKGKPIPDRTMADSRRIKEFNWCPEYLITGPDREKYNWTPKIKLSYLQKFIGGGLTFVSENEEITDPDVKQFFEKYY